VESFFRRIVAEMLSVFKGICKRAGALPQLPTKAPVSICSVAELQLFVVDDHKEHDALLKELLGFAEDVDNVRGYVMTNAQVGLDCHPR